jgi:uncharacterized protein YbjT (DUF2867 family)
MIDVALIGGSGLIGKKVVQRLAPRDDIAFISYVRREPHIRYERQLDFEMLLHDGGEVLGVEHIDVAISCLGTTMKDAGSKGAFRRVDYDYVRAFAQAARRYGARQFILVSSVGASRRTSNYYLYVKAEIEAAILKLGYERVDIIRPGLLLGSRREFRLGEWLAGRFVPLLHPLLRGEKARYRATRAETVARAVAELTGAGAPGQFLYENPQLDLVAER